MRNTLTSDIDRAKYDAILNEKGRQAANRWVDEFVTLYDVYEAPRSFSSMRSDMPGEARRIFRATMENVGRFLDMHPDATKRVLCELRELGISFIYHNRGRFADYFHGIRPAQSNLTPNDGTKFEAPTDMKRLHEASYVAVHFPDADGGPARELAFDGRLLDIALDVGPHVWVHASYADALPEGAVQVGDGRSPGYSFGGERIISVPAEWCAFYTDAEAEGIQQMKDADDRLLSYAR